MRRQNIPLVLLTSFIVSACFTYYAASDCMRYRDTCFPTGNAGQMSPYRYRVLEPFLMRPFGDTQNHTVMAAIVYFALFNTVTFPALYTWLRRSLSPDRAVIGLMVYGLVNVAAYHLWYLNLNIPLEMLFLSLFLALIDRSWKVLLPIIILASLNRETTLYLAAIYTVWHWNDHQRRGGFILIGVWVAITISLHLALGASEHVNGSFAGMLQYNLGNLPDAIFCNLILSPIYLLTWRGFRAIDIRYKRLAVLGLLYMVASSVGGNWGEMQRYMLPVLPVLLPVVLIERPVTAPSPLTP